MYRQMSAYGCVCNGKANRIPIIAECASPTPLESLIPDVLFVPNEIEVNKTRETMCTVGRLISRVVFGLEQDLENESLKKQ